MTTCMCLKKVTEMHFYMACECFHSYYLVYKAELEIQRQADTSV